MKKTIIIAVLVLAVLGIAFGIKHFYVDRYVVTGSYYTQIPSDDQGKEQAQGTEFYLLGYDEDGKSKKITFTIPGEVNDYYDAGTYIQVQMSKKSELATATLAEQDVPQKALEKIKTNGTKIKKEK